MDTYISGVLNIHNYYLFPGSLKKGRSYVYDKYCINCSKNMQKGLVSLLINRNIFFIKHTQYQKSTQQKFFFL